MIAFAVYFSYAFISSVINLKRHFLSLYEGEPLTLKQRLSIPIASSVFILEMMSLLFEYFEKNYKFYGDAYINESYVRFKDFNDFYFSKFVAFYISLVLLFLFYNIKFNTQDRNSRRSDCSLG